MRFPAPAEMYFVAEDSAFEKWWHIYFSIDKDLSNLMTAKRLSCSLVSAQITSLGRRHFLSHLRKSHICLKYSSSYVFSKWIRNNFVALFLSCYKVTMVFVNCDSCQIVLFLPRCWVPLLYQLIQQGGVMTEALSNHPLWGDVRSHHFYCSATLAVHCWTMSDHTISCAVASTSISIAPNVVSSTFISKFTWNQHQKIRMFKVWLQCLQCTVLRLQEVCVLGALSIGTTNSRAGQETDHNESLAEVANRIPKSGLILWDPRYWWWPRFW